MVCLDERAGDTMVKTLPTPVSKSSASPALGIKGTIDDLPKLLRSVRQKRKLTLKEVEAQTGLSISTISRIENGSITPGAETYLRLMQWLKVKPEIKTSDAHTGDTLTEISLVLKRDARLTAEARDKLLRAWRPMYELYASDMDDA
jgi:transcriptional regulator with XRE-family HTH domain